MEVYKSPRLYETIVEFLQGFALWHISQSINSIITRNVWNCYKKLHRTKSSVDEWSNEVSHIAQRHYRIVRSGEEFEAGSTGKLSYVSTKGTRFRMEEAKENVHQTKLYRFTKY